MSDEIEREQTAPPRVAEEAAQVEIHKPKPWHGWGEFGKELGTIVLGVMIALGGEQAVEWLHQSHEVGEAREALRQEIASNAAIAVFSTEEDKCFQARLGQYEAWADGGARPTEHGLSTLPLQYSTWDTVKTGPVTHMPLKERLAYAEYYGWVANHENILDEERRASMELHQVWTHDPLDAVQAGRLKEAIKVAHNISNIRITSSGNIIDRAAALGIKPRPLTADEQKALPKGCDI